MPRGDMDLTFTSRTSEGVWHPADRPPRLGQKVTARATDKDGSYLLPFPVTVRGGQWCNANTGSPLTAAIKEWKA